jgi:hypothetical protein
MTRHIHADHMIAAANDTSIEWQYTPKALELWNDCIDGIPAWHPESEYRQKPAPHPHQAMIDQAAADPSIVWQFEDGYGDWMDFTNGDLPLWSYAVKYRQKPDEPKMVDMWLWAIKHDCGDIYISDLFHRTKEDAQDYNTKNIICRIEGSKITVPEVSQ